MVVFKLGPHAILGFTVGSTTDGAISSTSLLQDVTIAPIIASGKIHFVFMGMRFV
jgi:hypothetical protein